MISESLKKIAHPQMNQIFHENLRSIFPEAYLEPCSLCGKKKSVNRFGEICLNCQKEGDKID